jgi:hypothetical protein
MEGKSSSDYDKTILFMLMIQEKKFDRNLFRIKFLILFKINKNSQKCNRNRIFAKRIFYRKEIK